MADNNYSGSDIKDKIARMLAIAGILLSLLALGWAMKADNDAKNAEKQQQSSQQSNTEGTGGTTTPATTAPATNGGSGTGGEAGDTGNITSPSTGTNDATQQ